MSLGGRWQKGLSHQTWSRSRVRTEPPRASSIWLQLWASRPPCLALQLGRPVLPYALRAVLCPLQGPAWLWEGGKSRCLQGCDLNLSQTLGLHFSELSPKSCCFPSKDLLIWRCCLGRGKLQRAALVSWGQAWGRNARAVGHLIFSRLLFLPSAVTSPRISSCLRHLGKSKLGFTAVHPVGKSPPECLPSCLALQPTHLSSPCQAVRQ